MLTSSAHLPRTSKAELLQNLRVVDSLVTALEAEGAVVVSVAELRAAVDKLRAAADALAS